jgi:hypothetical protein
MPVFNTTLFALSVQYLFKHQKEDVLADLSPEKGAPTLGSCRERRPKKKLLSICNGPHKSVHILRWSLGMTIIAAIDHSDEELGGGCSEDHTQDTQSEYWHTNEMRVRHAIKASGNPFDFIGIDLGEDLHNSNLHPPEFYQKRLGEVDERGQ